MPNFRFSLRALLLAMFFLGGVFAVAASFLRYLGEARHAAERLQMQGRFKGIIVSLHNYEDAHASLPLSVTEAADGTPLHSWRVQLLPYIEHRSFFAQYRQSEPWNSPHNAALCNVPMSLFEYRPHRNHANHCTNLVVVRGTETLFPPGKALSLHDIQDDPSETIVLVEIDRSDILWYEPRDLEFDAMSFRINDPDKSQTCIGGDVKRGAIVAFADGSIRMLPNDTPPEVVRAMLTIAGGETIPPRYRASTPQ